MKPPKYYDRMKELDEKEFKRIRRARKINASKHSENNTKERLRVRRVIQETKLKRLERKL